MRRFYFAVRRLAIVLVFTSIATTIRADGFIETFDDIGFRDRWFFSNYEQKGDWFLTAWRKKLVSVVLSSSPNHGGGALRLQLNNSDTSAKPYFGAEVQRGNPHHFGSYEFIMRPARGDGIVSAFFLYTGPYFGDPHDEIDFEFLGKDTRKVWVNKFADGERMPGKHIDLPFDAANQLGVYRLEWQPDSITWYINDIELHSITAESHSIPQTPAKLMLNIWAGNDRQIAWLGRANREVAAEMLVYCVSYRPPGDFGLTCSEYAGGKW